jgi:outer membrane protein OmpA-like peptidoglycan-associated protein
MIATTTTFQTGKKPPASRISRLQSARTSLLQRKCACGGTPGPFGECEECRTKRLQRKVVQSSTLNHQHSEVPPIVHEVLRSPGHPLDAAPRAFFEPRFGHNFGEVRVHTDAQAAESARAVNALAFTVGRDVVFAEGRYQPATHEGRKLVAHELTHVIQQASDAPHSIAAFLEIGDSFDPAEREANAAADRIMSGDAPPHIETAALNVVQRLGDLTKVPAGLGCPVANSTPAAPVTNVFTFAQNSFTLNAVQIAELEDFVRAWHHAGTSDHVRIDGFASTEGTDEFNWTLSCQRAEAVLAALTSPPSRTTPGIPAGFIEEFAQGETDEFGTTLASNRRAQITTTLVIPPVSLIAPACPLGSSSTRMTATIQPVRVARNDGSNPTVLPSFARLDIWRRCCVDFTIAAPVTINSTAMQIVDDTGGAPTAEEAALSAAAPAGTQINVIIVKNFDTGGGVLNPDSGGGALTNPGTGAAHETVIAVEGSVSEVIAHEVGHAIGASHVCPDTIMCGTGAHDVPNPEHVNAGICTAARTGAVLTPSATPCCLNAT